jgi:tetratricopeptide (TPR) repeat protein
VLYDLLLGEIAGNRGQLEVAVTSLQRAALKTRDVRVAERATLVALYARRPAEAITSARLWLELQPSAAEAREALATALIELGELQEARRHLDGILAAAAGAGHLGQSYLRIAAVLGRQQQRGAALEVMQTLVTQHPDNPEGQFALAHVAVRASDLDAALAAIERTLALRPGWEEAALFKVRILVSRKDDKRLAAFYEQFLDDYPRARELRLNYARHLLENKQWDKAREQFKRVVADNPTDADALFAVGLLALQAEVYDEAERYLQLTLEQSRDNDQARLYLGQIAEKRKRYDEALRWYREIGPGGQHFEAQVRIALTIARQGDVAAARAHLDGLTPENDNQVVQLALSEEQLLREAKLHHEAFEALSRALARLPDNADLLYARALAAERIDRLEVVESDLRRILRNDPKNASALNALGYTLADRTTRYQEALALLEQALALKPDDPYIMDSMGWVQYRLGNHAEALKYLRAALEKRNDAEIAAHLGEVLWMTGDRAGAESVWRRALQDTPDNEALLGVIRKFKP